MTTIRRERAGQASLVTDAAALHAHRTRRGDALLLVTVVLPAEYAIDPTGIGRVLGLTQMGEIKMSLAAEAAAAEAAEVALLDEGAAVAAVADSAPAAAVADSAAPSSRSDVTTITLRPNEGKEVKLEMQEGASVTYTWSVEGGVVNYDTHGDPYDAPREFYHGYGKGLATPGQEGVLVAAFDGLHGWFWRNRTGLRSPSPCERKASIRVCAGHDGEHPRRTAATLSDALAVIDGHQGRRRSLIRPAGSRPFWPGRCRGIDPRFYGQVNFKLSRLRFDLAR
jgi:hypothetical protein